MWVGFEIFKIHYRLNYSGFYFVCYHSNVITVLELHFSWLLSSKAYFKVCFKCRKPFFSYQSLLFGASIPNDKLNKSRNHIDTFVYHLLFVLMEFYNYLEKNWSSQNWSSWTSCADPDQVTYLKEELTWAIDIQFWFISIQLYYYIRNRAILSLQQYCMNYYVVLSDHILCHCENLSLLCLTIVLHMYVAIC